MSEEEFSQQYDRPGEGGLPENSGVSETTSKSMCQQRFFFQSSPDVTGVMLITNDGIPLQTTVDSDTTVQVSEEC